MPYLIYKRQLKIFKNNAGGIVQTLDYVALCSNKKCHIFLITLAYGKGAGTSFPQKIVLSLNFSPPFGGAFGFAE